MSFGINDYKPTLQDLLQWSLLRPRFVEGESRENAYRILRLFFVHYPNRLFKDACPTAYATLRRLKKEGALG